MSKLKYAPARRQEIKQTSISAMAMLPVSKQKRFYFIFHKLLCLTCFVSCFCTTSVSQAQSKPMHIYLLIGQSNMAGRGIVEKEDQQIHPSVLMLDKNNEWKAATDPMHFDKPVAGVGPGLSFGKMMAEADSTIIIGLVPCAAGGSSIDSWKPGGYHDQTKSYPYDDAIKRAKKAMQTGELKGILWHQGESDSTPEQAKAYARKLKILINSLRKELDAPQVPFVVATLSGFYIDKNPMAVKINTALQALPTHVKYTGCVSTIDLTHKGDTLHFDAASARELGKRYAKAIQPLQRSITTK